MLWLERFCPLCLCVCVSLFERRRLHSLCLYRFECGNAQLFHPTRRRRAYDGIVAIAFVLWYVHLTHTDSMCAGDVYFCLFSTAQQAPAGNPEQTASGFCQSSQSSYAADVYIYGWIERTLPSLSLSLSIWRHVYMNGSFQFKQLKSHSHIITLTSFAPIVAIVVAKALWSFHNYTVYIHTYICYRTWHRQVAWLLIIIFSFFPWSCWRWRWEHAKMRSVWNCSESLRRTFDIMSSAFFLAPRQ